MILVYESWKRIISNPLINVISICLGLAFTTIFSFYNSITAVKFSIILLMFVLFFSLILAIIRKDKQNVLEVAKRLNENDKHKYALRILTKAQKKTADDEIKLRIGCSMGSVYCSMGNYQQAIHVLLEALNICDSKWTWEVYYQLIDAFSHKDGYFADKTLDAYLNCIKYRKKYDIYGKENLKLDIQLSHDIYKIYEVWKDYISSNKWFREEMLLRDAACDIVTKNRIKYLSEQASILENKNQAEDALRQYEQAAYLIKKYISVNCFQYAVVQLQMGRLFYRGYEPPRYKLALECFQNAIKIKRKYISDIPEKLSRSFSDAYSNIKELCMISIDDIYDSFNAFAALSASGKKMSDKQFKQLVHLRNEVLYQCQEILPLMEEIYLAESLELADIYYLIGEAYKWNPLRSEDINIGMAYFEKTAKIWRKHNNNESIQSKLAELLVDMGGLYLMQKDEDTALIYRLEALKIISSVENADMEIVGNIELSLILIYEHSKQSKTINYDLFLKQNGLSTVIESIQRQPLENGLTNFKVKLLEIEKEFNWQFFC